MLEFTFEFSAITLEHSCSEAFLCPNTAFYGGIRADEIVPLGLQLNLKIA